MKSKFKIYKNTNTGGYGDAYIFIVISNDEKEKIIYPEYYLFIPESKRLKKKSIIEEEPEGYKEADDICDLYKSDESQFEEQLERAVNSFKNENLSYEIEANEIRQNFNLTENLTNDELRLIKNNCSKEFLILLTTTKSEELKKYLKDKCKIIDIIDKSYE